MLTRKMLSAMEIDADKVSQIIDGHAETVTALQEEIDKAKGETAKYKAEAEKLSGVQKELNDLKAKVEADAKEREGKDYDALKKEYDDYKAEVQRQAVRAGKEAAYREILKDAGIPERHFAKILKYSDVDGVELDDKGKIKTAKDILKAVKEEWADHIETTTVTGASTETPPANTTGTAKTREEIMAIKDRNERQQAISENHALFGY